MYEQYITYIRVNKQSFVLLQRHRQTQISDYFEQDKFL